MATKSNAKANTESKSATATSSEPSQYEKNRGLVPRGELIANIPKLMADLDDAEFHDLYDLIWHMSTLHMMENSARCRVGAAKTRITELEAELAQLKAQIKTGAQ